MGFISFIGRVTFSAIFILAAWQKIQDFGQDGGGALKALDPKFDLFVKNVNETLNLNLSLPGRVETKHLLMVAIALEGLGGLLFTLGSSLGAYLLVDGCSLCYTPLYPCSIYKFKDPKPLKYGLEGKIIKLCAQDQELIFLAAVTPILHDFYNYDLSSPEYLHHFNSFLKNLSLFGSLLFFLGMKNSAYRQMMRKKQPLKAKTQ